MSASRSKALLLVLALSALLLPMVVTADEGWTELDAMIPTDGLQLWLMADKGLHTADGAVEMWMDQSGKGNHASAVSGTSPLLVLDAVNGRAAIRFDGRQAFLTVADASDLNAESALSLFVVFQYDGDGIRLMQKKSGTAGNELDAWYVNPRNGLGVAGVRYTKTTFERGGFHVQTSIFSAADGTIETYRDGELVSTVSNARAQMPNTDPLYIGKRSHPTSEQHLEGDIAEIIVYNTALTETERTQVEQYLENKYGLQTTVCVPIRPSGPMSCSQTGAGCGQLLADDYQVLWESPDPRTVYSGTPGILKLESGRLIAAMTFRGPGTSGPNNGLVFTSDDHGETWQPRAHLSLVAPRPFEAGGAVYILGHNNDLVIYRSEDQGETWSEASQLTWGQNWQGAATDVVHANGRVYQVMERIVAPGLPGWPVAVYTPVVLSAAVDDDLTSRSSWTFSNEITFLHDAAPLIKGIGAPFFAEGATAPRAPGGRKMHPMGWLEANLIQIRDPKHIWYDPNGRTFHILMRAHTGATNLAALARVEESPEGRLTVSIEEAPSGEPMVFIPLPGGQMKFFVMYDEPSQLFWLVSSQSTDSMTRPELLPADRYSLPNNERHRLALYYSKNAVDWIPAGLVSVGRTPREARHYAAMTADGEDLLIVSRSGDNCALNAHDGNLVTLHRVRNFRDLVIP